ncbi:MAG: hypothetical protein Q4F66_14730 [Clostridium sp.]|nr:hypothetical protein [Clostridium sp.]
MIARKRSGHMLCERCKAKGEVRRQVLITCVECGEEEYAPLYNNNRCKKCNEAAHRCEECGRKIEESYIKKAR